MPKLPDFKDPNVMKQINDSVAKKIAAMKAKGIEPAGLDEEGTLVLPDYDNKDNMNNNNNEPNRQ